MEPRLNKLNKNAERSSVMSNYTVQIRVGRLFEDVTVTARNEKEAVRKARKLSTFAPKFLRWAAFVI